MFEPRYARSWLIWLNKSRTLRKRYDAWSSSDVLLGSFGEARVQLGQSSQREFLRGDRAETAEEHLLE